MGTRQLISGILGDLKDTFAESDYLEEVLKHSEIKESITDYPMLQIYVQHGEQDPTGTADRSTFGAQQRQTRLVIHMDYYAQPRSHIGEDMERLVDGIDEISAIIEAQDKKPYFGSEAIKSFSWNWDRVEFVYGNNNYVGARFYLRVRIY